MIPGPHKVFKCPKCGIMYHKPTLHSGNTFGARFYTDGKRIAHMLPEYPNITKCRQCDTIFWLEKSIGEFGPFGENPNSKFDDAVRANFLTEYEYKEAIDRKLFRSASDEIYLKMKLWHAFNDRVRDFPPDTDDATLNAKLFPNDTDKTIYTENCHSLIAILDKNNENHKMIVAELHRNLGNFDDSIAILNQVSEQNYKVAVDFISKKSKEQKRFCCQMDF